MKTLIPTECYLILAPSGRRSVTSVLEAAINKALLWVTSRDIVATRASQIFGKNITQQDLRRTYISSLLANGVDISPVSKLAGHKSITTPLYYRRGSDSLINVVDTVRHDV